MKKSNAGKSSLNPKWVVTTIAVVAIVAVVMFSTAVIAATQWSHEADPSTSTPPSSSTISTEDVGQVWTDKTVADNSDGSFNVTLSALSSAGSSTVVQQQPLDIVLVLDTSGSMSAASEYVYASDLDTSKTYISDPYNSASYDYNTQYFHAGDTIEGVHRHTFEGTYDYTVPEDGWYVTYYGERVYPMTSATDTNSNHTPFWSTTRLDELKTAVDGFIDATNDLNAGITDSSKINRIAVVKFAGQERSSDASEYIGNDTYTYNGNTVNYTQVLSDFTTDLDGLKTQVDALSEGGQTRSDYAFDYAQQVMSGNGSLQGARSDAKRIVIFFTDGVPTIWNDFSSSVANTAVGYSRTLKADSSSVTWDGVEVYSIGTFDGVNPEHHDTSATTDAERANTFLNAISSNYPNATAWNSLGTRVNDTDQYFYGSENATELSSIYDNIFQRITTSSGYPVSIASGETADTSGYVTFTDTLGSYMKVSSMGSMVFKDASGTTYTVSPTSSTTSGNVTTYTYSQAVKMPSLGDTSSSNTRDTNLDKIIVTVTSTGDSDPTGDIVTMQVPIGLMPLDVYDVQTQDGETTLSTSGAEPIKLNYTVKMKDTYKDAIDQQDFSKISDSYLQANTDSDGNLHFYANAYSEGDVDGQASASFTPSASNGYYYFTSDTPLYSDDSGTLATSTSSTYYYKVTYWEASSNGGTATKKEKYVELDSAAVERLNAAGSIKQKDGNYYVASGAVHYDNLTTTEKESNPTSTATNSSSLSMSSGVVSNALGNNGDLYTPRPGKLSITKYVELPAGAADHSDDTFNFSIYVEGATGTHTVSVVDESGDVVADAPTSITFTGGNASCTLKAGQTITIENLQSGSSYTVTETTPLPDGYTNTSKTGDTGTINANKTSAATFTNEYSMSPLTPEVTIPLEKVMDGRNFKSGDQFTFYINPSYSGDANITNPPLPSNVTAEPGTKAGYITITPSDTSTNTYTLSSLGTITFEHPGTYTYSITETVGSISGVSYSRAQYTLTVKVKDNGDGTLAIESGPTLVQDYDDSGVATGSTATSATFTNTYNATNITTPLLAAKIYRDTTGDGTLQEDQFLYELVPTGDNAADAPMPTGTTGTGSSRVYYANNDASGKIDLGSLTLTQQLLNGQSSVTFTYQVSEIIDDPRTTEVETADPNITYDKGTHTIEVTLTRDASTGELSSTVVYKDDGTTVSGGNRFTNTYAATSTTAQLSGSKTLVGRAMQDGESFKFTLTPDTATQTAIDDGELTMPSDTTVSVSGGANGQAVSFNFDSIEFSHEGTYRFYIDETKGSAGGVSYDSHRCTVTVTVTDNNGQLEATVDYGTYLGNPANQFRNTYEATMTYPGVNVAKTLTGHALAANQFTYTITGVNSGTVTADEANVKLSATDQSFTNPSAAADGEQSVWTKLAGISFDQDDIGKTYSYRVVEVNDGKSGYTYDSNVYTVSITVIDNGDGTLKTSTTVTNGDGSYSQTVENTSQAAADGTEDVPRAAQSLALVPFANSYSATGTLEGATNLRVQKTLSGREWANGDTFNYTIEPTGTTTVDAVNAGDIVMPTTWLNIDNTTSNHTAAFGNITFKKAGEYQFLVKETLPEDDDPDTEGVQSKGVTYDESEKIVKVTVTDNGDGTLTCTKSADSDSLTFENTYKAKPTTASWNGQKTLENRDFKTGDEFTFQISGSYSGSATDVDVPMPAVLENVTESNGTKTGTWTWKYSDYGTSNPTYIDARNFSLLSGDLSFAAPGTYTYEIVEESGTLPGITYSQAHYRCTVVVTDKGQGQLNATTTLTQLNDDEGNATNSQQTGPAVFTNTAASDITTTLRATKSYVDTTGTKPLENGMFSFTLKPTGDNADTAPMPTGSTGEGDDRTYTATNQGTVVSLGSLKLTQDDVGNTYHYIVQEEIPSGATNNNDGTYTLNGMTYDAREHEVSVEVTQDSSTNEISATVTWTVDDSTENAQVFSNRYEPNPVTVEVKGTKTLNGRDMLADEEFDFTLSPANDATRSAITNGDITVANTSTSVSGATDGTETSFTFGDVTFKKVGTYTFTMSETPGSAGGVTYDTHDCTVTVTVSDGGDGSLAADVSYGTYTPEGGSQRAGNSFINTYEPKDATLPVTVTKVLSGRTPGLQAGEFTFNMTVERSDGEGGWSISAPAGTTAGTATNQANGTVSFGSIVFSETGTYKVTVTEAIPNPKSTFMTYDEHVYSFVVVVTDNQTTGNLEAATSQVTNSSVFTNTFDTPDDTKTVDEKDSAGSVQVENADGEMVSVGDQLTYTVHWVNTALDENGAPAAATVTVTDRIPDGTTFVSAASGGQYDETSRTITWTIDANAEQQGDLTFDVKVDDSVYGLPHQTVENKATITINDVPADTNTVRNSVPKKTVMNSAGSDIDNQSVTVGQTLKYRISYTNVEDEPIDITITDTLEDGLDFVSAESGTYDESTRTITWSLTNVQAKTNGYVEFTARVNETALGDKSVDNTGTVQIGNQSEVTNTTHNTVTTGAIGLSKTVQLDDPTSTSIDTTKEFTFTVTIVDANGDELENAYPFSGTSDGSTPYAGTITSGGTITLKSGGSVTITDLPTGATWTIQETKVDGYTADQWTRTGTVPATGTVAASFANTYKLTENTIPLEVTKVLAGDRDPGLQEGEFTFHAQVTAADGSPSDGFYMTGGVTELDVTNAADGSVDFGNIHFTKVGTYEVTVTEVIPDPESAFMEYDEHTYSFPVTVTDNGDGTLKIEKGTETGSSTFTNTFNPPDDTKTVTKIEGTEKIDVDGQLVGVGDQLTYTIDWTNDALDSTGKPIAAEVTVTDVVPDGTEYVVGSAKAYDASGNDITSNITISGPDDDDKITWTLGEQDAGATGSVSFVVEITDDAVDLTDNTIKNTANIKLGDDDPKTTNEVTNIVPEKDVNSTHTNSDSTTTTITDADGNLVGVGDVLTYTISWQNTSGSAADVVVTDTLPDGTSYVDGSGGFDSGHSTGTFVEPDNDGKMTWTIHEAASGDSGTVTYQVKVEESIYDLATPTVVNQASVQIGNNPSVNTNTTENPTPKKDVSSTHTNSDSTTTTITDADGKLVGVGDQLTYTIHWQNSTDSTATVTITDDVPDGTTFVSADNDGAESNGTVTWSLGEKDAGASGTVSFTVTVDESATELADRTVENTAYVKIGDNPAVSTNTTENPVPKKEVDNASGTNVNDSDVKVGDVLTYTISYTNGETTASTVTITDVVPTGTTFVSAENGGTENDGTVTWTVSNVAAGASGTVSFKVKVTEAALTSGEIENTAEVKVGDDNPAVKTNPVDNTVKTGEIKISKTSSAVAGQELPDATFTFKVTLYDTSGAELTGSYSFSGTSDGSTAYSSTVASGGTVTLKNNGTITITGLPEGASWTVEEVDVPAGFSPNPTVHQGTVPDTSAADSSFSNTYDTQNVELPVKLRKVLNGRDLVDGEFSFTMAVKNTTEGATSTVGWSLEDASGSSLGTPTSSEATNDAEGVIDFGTITFSQPGTYSVTVTENEGTLPFVTYDTTPRSFVVTITDVNSVLTYQLTDADGNEISLSDLVFTNTYNPPDDTKTVSDPTLEITDADGKQVQIGDTLHYTVNWVNDALDENGKSADATVTITDTVPDGTTYTADSAKAYDEDGTEITDGVTISGPDEHGKITWTLTDRAAGATGSVAFDVTVDESVADNAYVIDNQASVKVDGDDPKVTNTTHNTVPEKDVANVTHNVSNADGQLVGLGDTLEYTVHWRNDATDEQGNPTSATVTITDTLPAYTTYVSGSASDGGVYTANADYSHDSYTPGASEVPSTASKGGVTWTLENVAAGAEGTVSFQVTVDEDAYELRHNDINNTATIQINDGPVVTNTTTNLVPEKTVIVGDGSSSSPLITNDGQPVQVGDTLTYRIQYWNAESGDADMTAYDVVPEGTEYVEGSAKLYRYGSGHTGDTIVDISSEDDVTITVGGDGSNITWSYKGMASGTAGYATFQVKVTEEATELATMSVDNQATCQIGHSPTVTTNEVTNPTPKKDVSVTPASDPDTVITDADGKLVGVGDVLTYTVYWKNTESSAATVTIKDAVPDGTTYVGGSATTGTGITLDTPNDGETGTVTWTIADVAAGASGTVTFKVKVDESATQLEGRTVENTATVQINDDSEVKTNTTENPVPGKTVGAESGTGETKTTITDADGRVVGVGDVLTYKVYWTNGESDDATVTVTDTVPDGTTLVDDSAKAYLKDGDDYTDMSVTGSVSGSDITWSLGEQASGASGYVEFQVTVTDDVMSLATPQVDNTATVQIGDNPSVSTNKVTNPTPGKDVSVTPSGSTTVITDGNGVLVGVGDELTYTVSWQNDAVDSDGNPTSAKVTITDEVPEGTEYVSSSAAINVTENGPVSDDSATESDGTVTWSFTAPASAKGTVTFKAKVTEDAMGLEKKQVENTAYVQIGEDNPVVKTNTTENPVPSKSVDQQSGTTVIKDADGKLVGIGDTLYYRIDWQNNATGTADVTITDTVPDGTVYQDGSAGGAGATVSGPDEDSQITWVISAAQPGASGYVYFRVTVDESAVDLTDDSPTSTIENEATVTINDKPSVTNKVTNVVPEKTATSDDGSSVDSNVDSGSSVTVGDEITYTIGYENTESSAATVTVSDVVPTGTVYVGDSATTGDNITLSAPEDGKTGTVTWTIANVEAGGSGTVSFKAKVTDEAVKTGKVENTSTIQIGDDNPEVSTNTTTTNVKYGSLNITKTVAKADDSLTPYDASFTFKVTFSGATDTDTYDYTVKNADGTENRTGTVKSGGTLSLKAGQTAIFASLPDGATWTVEEQNLPSGFSIADADKSKTGTISADSTATAAFKNTYRSEGTGRLMFTKRLTGRSWTDSDSFTFTLKPTGDNAADAPMPDGSTGSGADRTATATATKPTSGTDASFGFDIKFDKAGTFTYEVTETNADQTINGITYTANVGKVTVKVTDDGRGKLTPSYTYTNQTFVNTYEPGTVDFDATAGLQIVKTMTNADIETGEFGFTLKGDDAASTAKLTGGKDQTYSTIAQTGSFDSSGVYSATETVAATTGLKFTKDDVNKTYSYTVKETIPDGATDNHDGTFTKDGITYDDSTHTLKFEVSDQGDGTLVVKVTVDGSETFTLTSSGGADQHDPASFTFANSYDTSDTAATIEATKTLTGRKLEAGEFTFRIVNALDSSSTTVATATNDADGKVTFTEIGYSLTQLLKDNADGLNTTSTNSAGQTVYTYTYTASEYAPAAGTGVSREEFSATVTVKVTDDGKGNLSTAIVYPNGGSQVEFKNTYDTDTVDVTFAGSKQLDVPEGATAPNIAGKYTFTLQPIGDNASTAPMPAGTTGMGAARSCTTTNQADGTVSFGTITYSLATVFGDDTTTDSEDSMTRTKVFDYQVTETSGSVAHITNDTNVYTFTVTVTDDGEGHLTAVTNPSAGELFTFTNTLTFDPVTSSFTAKKSLDVTKGKHTMAAGEFEFELVDADGTVVATGTNDADGTIQMSEVEFSEVGDFSYTLKELQGSNDEMTYDTTAYQVTASVSADSNNDLQVDWKFYTQDPSSGETVEVEIPEFNNGFEHEPQPTTVVLGASKTVKDGSVKAGQYSFVLTDENGETDENGAQRTWTATNKGNGSVTFDELTFDTEGTYRYTISEVLPEDDDPETAGIQKDGITYDESVYEVTVTVVSSEELSGDMVATVDYDASGSSAPSFTNEKVPEKTTPPTTPPSTPPTTTNYTRAPKTGDETKLLLACNVATIGMLAFAFGLNRHRRSAKKE